MPTTDSKALQFWPVPAKGIWRHVPPYQIPDDALYDSFNMVEMDGVLRYRPGLEEFAFSGDTGISEDIVGATMYYSAAGVRHIVLATEEEIWSFNGDTEVWTDRTLTPFTGAFTNKARFAHIVLGNTSATSYVIITNGVDAPQKWDGVAGTASTLAGTPPHWTDIAVISDRVMGIVPPYNVSWGPVRQIDSWPALNYHQAAFTPDPVVALGNLGVQGGVLYKEQSIWTISPTGQDSDAKAYRFELYGMYEGPANPAALVIADGLHVRMTTAGRIGVFDGSKHSWVGDGVWPVIQESITPERGDEICGLYDPINLLVYFFWPSAGATQSFVIVTLPRPGREDFGCFLGAYETLGQVGAGLNYIPTPQTNVPASLPLVFLGNDVYSTNKNAITDAFPNVGDDTRGFEAFWQTGLFKLPESMRVEGLEVYANRGDFGDSVEWGEGNLTIEPVTSWLLARSAGPFVYGGALGPQSYIDLGSPIEQPRDLTGLDVRARFIGIRFSCQTRDSDAPEDPNTRIFYKGATLLGQKMAV